MLTHLDVCSPIIESLKVYWDSLLVSRNLPPFFDFFSKNIQYVQSEARHQLRKDGIIPVRPTHPKWRKPRIVSRVLGPLDYRMRMFYPAPPSRFASFEPLFIDREFGNCVVDFTVIDQALSKFVDPPTSDLKIEVTTIPMKPWSRLPPKRKFVEPEDLRIPVVTLNPGVTLGFRTSWNYVSPWLVPQRIMASKFGRVAMEESLCDYDTSVIRPPPKPP